VKGEYVVFVDFVHPTSIRHQIRCIRFSGFQILFFFGSSKKETLKSQNEGETMKENLLGFNNGYGHGCSFQKQVKSNLNSLAKKCGTPKLKR
jgi:hypothetical protein